MNRFREGLLHKLRNDLLHRGFQSEEISSKLPAIVGFYVDYHLNGATDMCNKSDETFNRLLAFHSKQLIEGFTLTNGSTYFAAVTTVDSIFSAPEHATSVDDVEEFRVIAKEDTFSVISPDLAEVFRVTQSEIDQPESFNDGIRSNHWHLNRQDAIDGLRRWTM